MFYKKNNILIALLSAGLIFGGAYHIDATNELEDNIETVRDKIVDLEEEQAYLENENAMLEKEFKRAVSEYDILSEDIELKDNELKELKEKIEQKDSEIEGLEGDLQAKLERESRTEGEAIAKAEPQEENEVTTSSSDSNEDTGGKSLGAFNVTHYAVSDGLTPSTVTANGTDVSNTIYSPKGYRIIAVDTSVIPMNTLVEVTLNGETFIARASDTGSAINGNKIDLLVGSPEEALNKGVQTAEIKIVE